MMCLSAENTVSIAGQNNVAFFFVSLFSLLGKVGAGTSSHSTVMLLSKNCDAGTTFDFG